MRLRAGIDGGGRLVEDHDRAGRPPPRGRWTAAAAGPARGSRRWPSASCCSRRGRRVMKSSRVGQLRRRDAFLVGRVQLAVADVVHDRAGEQVHILQHDAERVAQVRLFDVVDVDAVIADLAVGDVVKAVDEVGDGGLARAGRADEGQLLPGLRRRGKCHAAPSCPAS